jgi:hypothetical protein
MNSRAQIMIMNFVDCYLSGVHAEEIDPTHIMCSSEAWFLLNECVNSQNKRY